jgi:GNAT superfamily N-acetyltransferase
MKKFLHANIVVTTYNTTDDATRLKFKEWALSLKPELDGGEYGADDKGEPLPNSAYLWVVEHNKSEAFHPGGLYATFIFMDGTTGEFLATGSIVPDDRGVGVTYKIGGAGFWGLINVRRDLRGKGIGKYVSAYMDEHVQSFIDCQDDAIDVSLFTANEVAAAIYKSLGFAFVRSIFIAEFDATEDLYTKTYTPRS